MAKQKTITKQKKEKKKEDKLKVNFQKYKKELEKIEGKYNGLLSTEIVLKEAKQIDNPLHSWFDWEDTIAGEKWRLHQARLLISSIRVKIMFDKGASSYRKYLNVTIETDGEPQRFYVRTEEVLKDEDLKEQILRRAVNEADYWQRTYKEYNELNEIFKGIAKTKKKLKGIIK